MPFNHYKWIKEFILLEKDKLSGGLADKYSPENFDSEQLQRGTEIELEHTDDYELAQEIAMDHLVEDPKYYDKLLAAKLEEVETLEEVSILKKKYPFQAIFILGPAGTGKTMITNLVGIPSNFDRTSSDERVESVFPIFGISLKYADSVTNPEDADLEDLQYKSRVILQNANIGHKSQLALRGTPLIFESTGEDVEKLGKKAIAFAELGYDVGFLIINVPPAVSIAGDASRTRQLGVRKIENISNEFQQKVVLGKYYHKLAQKNPNITLFGDVFPNIFDLRTGELRKGITPEMIKGIPQFDGVTFESSKKILLQIKNDIQSWVSLAGPRNKIGKTLLGAMRELVNRSKGFLGQNINDILIATTKPELVSPLIKKASEYLSDTIGMVQKAIGPKKQQEPSLRGLVSKSPYLVSKNNLLT